MPRALVIGADTAGLAGASNDAGDMATWLTTCGFAVDLRAGSAATRDGMLDGMRALAREIARDDAAVIYYAGHGGILEVSDSPSVRLGYLVPVDHEPDGRFRGIPELAWSGMIAALAARTRNIAVIHDCCHAAHTVRDSSSSRGRVRALAPMRMHESDLRAVLNPAWRELVHPLGNPEVVRITATSGHGLAWECSGSGGRVHGLFTSMLLTEAGALRERPVTWAELGGRVRGRVLRVNGRQRPELEGPIHRRVFSLVTDDVPSVPLRSRGRSLVLEAGSVHGVERGDAFRAAHSGRTVIVTRPGLFESLVRIDPAPVGAHTAMAAVRATRYPIVIEPGDETVRSAVIAAIQAAPRLCMGDATIAIAHVRTEPHGFVVVDAHGTARAILGHDADGIARLIAYLSRRAAACALRHIASEFEPSHELTLRVERVGTPSGWLGDGAEIRRDDRLCLHLTNHARRTLWLHMFAVGVETGVEGLGPVSSGLRIEAGATEVLGSIAGAGSVGFTLARSIDGGHDIAVPIELIAIATTVPVDLTCAGASSIVVQISPEVDRKVAAQHLEAGRDAVPPPREHRAIAAWRRFVVRS